MKLIHQEPKIQIFPGTIAEKVFTAHLAQSQKELSGVRRIRLVQPKSRVRTPIRYGISKPLYIHWIARNCDDDDLAENPLAGDHEWSTVFQPRPNHTATPNGTVGAAEGGACFFLRMRFRFGRPIIAGGTPQPARTVLEGTNGSPSGLDGST